MPQTGRKRKRCARACYYCRKAHLACDDQRPCRRCVSKEIECCEVEDRVQTAVGPSGGAGSVGMLNVSKLSHEKSELSLPPMDNRLDGLCVSPRTQFNTDEQEVIYCLLKLQSTLYR